jgi:2-polyprenyl-3-methyl-5-hydroxy-6-metoxy-1,4-benzoquinol methylase
MPATCLPTNHQLMGRERGDVSQEPDSHIEGASTTPAGGIVGGCMLEMTRKGHQMGGLSHADFDYSARTDLLDLLTETPRRVLDVGCGPGLNAGPLRRMGVEYVAGVEIDRAMAEKASKVLDHVWFGSVEDESDWPYRPGEFDAILCGDVLEHLRDPWAVVQRLASSLAHGGYFVASVPNLRNAVTLGNIIFRGSFHYQRAGVLERTHLRFFTRWELERLVRGAGLLPVRWHRRVLQDRRAHLLRWMTVGLAIDFCTITHYVVARRAGET